VEVRCELILNSKCSCGEGGREDVGDRSQGQIGRLIRRKEGWWWGQGQRERERE